MDPSCILHQLTKGVPPRQESKPKKRKIGVLPSKGAKRNPEADLHSGLRKQPVSIWGRNIEDSRKVPGEDTGEGRKGAEEKPREYLVWLT